MRKWEGATLKNIETIRPDKQLQELTKKEKMVIGTNRDSRGYSDNETPMLNLRLKILNDWSCLLCSEDTSELFRRHFVADHLQFVEERVEIVRPQICVWPIIELDGLTGSADTLFIPISIRNSVY